MGVSDCSFQPLTWSRWNFVSLFKAVMSGLGPVSPVSPTSVHSIVASVSASGTLPVTTDTMYDTSESQKGVRSHCIKMKRSCDLIFYQLMQPFKNLSCSQHSIMYK